MEINCVNKIVNERYKSKKCLLDDLVHFERGKNITTAEMHEGDVPVVSAGLSYSGYHNKANVKGPAITISASGANSGIVLFHNYDFWAADCSYSAKTSNMLFSKHFLRFLQPIITNLQRGAAQPHVYAKNVNHLKVEIPAPEIQDKIAKVLENYDQLIENNNKRIQLLEDMAEFLYNEWFIKSNDVCKTTKLADLMKGYFNGGWGKEEQEKNEKNEGYVIRGTDIPDVLNSYYDNVPLRFHSDNDIRNKQLQENDIIMELSNGNINNIGRTLLITKDLLDKYGNLMCASFCKTMRFKNNKDSMSALLLIRYLQNSGKMFFYKNTGTNGINNFNFKRFLKQDIYLLDDNVYLRIKDAYALASKYRQENYNLMKQRDSLLPRLMSGKLSVEGKEVI